MPMPLPSSQESTGSLAWGSQSDAPFSQGASQQSQQEMEAVTPVPSSQGRQVTARSGPLFVGSMFSMLYCHRCSRLFETETSCFALAEE